MQPLTEMVVTGELTEMQFRFCEEYLIDLNATEAAIRAGYSRETAYQAGWRLLRNVKVAAVIKERRSQLAQEIEIKQVDIIQKMMQIANRAMQGEPVLEFDPHEKAMVATGEWKFDGKTAHACWSTIAKMLGYIDNKTPAGEGSGSGFTLNIITRAAQLEMKEAGMTIDQTGAIVSHETSGANA